MASDWADSTCLRGGRREWCLTAGSFLGARWAQWHLHLRQDSRQGSAELFLLPQIQEALGSQYLWERLSLVFAQSDLSENLSKSQALDPPRKYFSFLELTLIPRLRTSFPSERERMIWKTTFQRPAEPMMSGITCPVDFML